MLLRINKQIYLVLTILCLFIIYGIFLTPSIFIQDQTGFLLGTDNLINNGYLFSKLDGLNNYFGTTAFRPFQSSISADGTIAPLSFPLISYLLYIYYIIFGKSFLVLFLPLISITSILLIISTLRLRVGSNNLLPILLVTISPTFIYFSLFLNNDSIVLLYGLTLLYFILRAEKTKRSNLFVMAIISIGIILLKPFAIFFFIPVGVYFLIKEKGYLKKFLCSLLILMGILGLLVNNKINYGDYFTFGYTLKKDGYEDIYYPNFNIEQTSEKSSAMSNVLFFDYTDLQKFLQNLFPIYYIGFGVLFIYLIIIFKNNSKVLFKNKIAALLLLGFLSIFLFLLIKLKVWGWTYDHKVVHGSYLRYIYPFFILLVIGLTTICKSPTIYLKLPLVFLSMVTSFTILLSGTPAYTAKDIIKLKSNSNEIQRIIDNYSTGNRIIFTEIIEVFDYKNKNILNIKHIPKIIRSKEIQRITTDKNYEYYIIIFNKDWLENFDLVNYEFLKEERITLDKILWKFQIYKIQGGG